VQRNTDRLDSLSAAEKHAESLVHRVQHACVRAKAFAGSDGKPVNELIPVFQVRFED
jgi:hypothetical protein